LWARVSSFTGFSFCKSHSASYAQLSFKCTYLKAHYPAQFFSAVISNNHGFYTPDVYLDEARRWGIRILPIDINASTVKYRGKHNWLRPGLMHVRNLSTRAMEGIISERDKNGRFYNLPDFLRRVDVTNRETENLVLIGAFDSFGLTRPELLYLLDGDWAGLDPANGSLFGQARDYSPGTLHPGLADYSFMEKCLHELRLLGYMLSGNIVDILDLHPASGNAVPAIELPDYSGRRVKVFGRRITERSHVVQKNGRIMKFLTIEDRTECIDVVLWPDIYERYSDELTKPGPFEIWGTVSEEWDTHTLKADVIRSVAWFPGQVDFRMASTRLEKSLRRVYTYEDIPTALAG
jgi:error-prone DNA polymerase